MKDSKQIFLFLVNQRNKSSETLGKQMGESNTEIQSPDEHATYTRAAHGEISTESPPQNSIPGAVLHCRFNKSVRGKETCVRTQAYRAAGYCWFGKNQSEAIQVVLL